MNRLGGRLSASTLGYRLRNALVAGKAGKNVVRASTSTAWSASLSSPFLDSWSNHNSTSVRFKSTAATATYDQSVDAFPSIVIGPDRSIEPQGSFAESQAEVCLNLNSLFRSDLGLFVLWAEKRTHLCSACITPCSRFVRNPWTSICGFSSPRILLLYERQQP